MPAPFLVIPILFFLVGTIISFADGKIKAGLFWLLLLVVTGGWLGYSLSFIPTVKKTLITQSSSVEESVVISYKNKNDILEIVNLNEVLKKNIPDKAKVKVTMYNGWYAGIYYNLRDSYEVLTTTE